MRGDKVLCSADSMELKAFGLTAGLTNWSAGYCTGLLLGRRLLKQVGLADVYKANDNRDGSFFNV
jgi:large subunit ribosomal protein L5e